MPIYEYQCRKCRKPFEQLVRSMNSDEPAVCPKCGGQDVEKVPSVFAAQAASSAPAPAMSGGCGHCNQAGSCPYQE